MKKTRFSSFFYSISFFNRDIIVLGEEEYGKKY